MSIKERKCTETIIKIRNVHLLWIKIYQYTSTSFLEVFFLYQLNKVWFTPRDIISQFICSERRIIDRAGDEVNWVLSAHAEFKSKEETCACSLSFLAPRAWLIIGSTHGQNWCNTTNLLQYLKLVSVEIDTNILVAIGV